MKKSKYQPCPYCHGRGKITLSIGKRARRRYAHRLKKYEQGKLEEKPKELIAHIDTCKHCNGSGLESHENFSKINPDYPHVAIIGGGIGGVALAVACLHRGIPYTLYERDESFDARSQGYGLTLQQASKAIEGLGIFDIDDGVTSTRHVVHDTNGKVIGEWGVRKFVDIEKENPNKRRNIHISRQELRAELLSGLHEAHDNIAWGHCLCDISQSQSGKLELAFEVGKSKKTDQADIVVGADGIRSKVRALSIGEEKTPLKYLGCIVILGICPLRSLQDIESELLDGATVFQTVNGFERIYMMPYDKDTIMWQLSFPICEQEAQKLSKDGPEALKAESLRRLGDWHTPIPHILSATDSTRITGYPVYDRDIMKEEFLQNIGNITLIGDAMHPMSPFKGQGANQALLDALDLARDISIKCNNDLSWREVGLRKTVLKDFESRMLKRSALKVHDSAKAAELLHTDAVLHEGDNPRGRGIE